eukprot:scaffold361197_cov33-Prasinocladus_malaysianus.AAC.1
MHEDDPGTSALFHTVFPVECRMDYLLWQTVALWYSFKKVGQPGSFTRLLACAEEDRKAFVDAGAMDLCPTHVTPSYTHYHRGDTYGPSPSTPWHWDIQKQLGFNAYRNRKRNGAKYLPEGGKLGPRGLPA